MSSPEDKRDGETGQGIAAAPIAVLNAGSSSIKFAVYGAGLRVLLRGQVEQIGVSPKLRVVDGAGRTLAERAASCPHEQAVERGEAHGGGHRSSVLEGAEARAVAEMGDDHTAAGAGGIEVPQPGRDVFVGQAVEAVAAHPSVVETAGQAEHLGEFRLRPVERRIEAGHLRDLRRRLGDGADRREVVWLVERGERDQFR